ncbi:MAG TPA: M48 family metalloprotease [Pyrinomonadaceae bacterium]|nr:M48 family metalloprotease [Pyrinomonadaceae bacterium]
MYHLLGLCLALAALLTANALAAFAVAGVWRGWLRGRTRAWSGAARAQLLFTLRVAPCVCALLFVCALVVPSYLRFEPAGTAEAVSVKLALLAALAILGLALAVWRGLVAWRTTRRLVADWLRHAEPVTLPGLDLPTYRVAHRFPVVAVVGAIRPRLFIAQQLFDALSERELRAALAHECGHLAARDNLKRAILRACRDVLTIVPAGRTLDRAWGASAEAAADEHAARGGDADTALDLAAALVKIARLVPKGARPAMPAGAFLIGAWDGENLAWRVRRLTQLAASSTGERSANANAFGMWLWTGSCAFLLTGASLIAADARVLAAIHTALEYAVKALK